MGTKDFYALDVLTMILGQGNGARLYQDIINRGLATDAWAYNPDNRYESLFIIGGSPNDPMGIKEDINTTGKREAYIKACRELETLLLKEVERIKEKGVTDRELKRVKMLAKMDLLETLRSNESIASRLATLEVQVGWKYLITYLDKIQEVEKEDVIRVVRRYLNRENMSVVYVIPGVISQRPEQVFYGEDRSGSPSLIREGKVQPDLKNHSIYPTPIGWKHPLSFERKPAKISYPRAKMKKIKGSTLFFLPDREIPLVDITILIKAGSVDIPVDKLGLTRMLERCLIDGGTEDYPPRELAMMLDENAIRISVSIGDEMSTVRLSVMKDQLQKGLDILQEILTRPLFAEDVLKSSKEQIISALKRQGGRARSVMEREAMIWHFKNHPYGRDPLQAIKTIPGVTRADMKKFLRRYFVPGNMVIAFSGDIEFSDAINIIEVFLDRINNGTPPPRDISDPSPTPPVLGFINKPGQIQSQIRMILSGVKRTNPDYWKLGFLIDLMGGEDSFIYNRLREDLGIVYATWFYQTYKWKAGIIKGYIGCKPSMTAEAIRETIRIMRELKEEIPAGKVEEKRLDIMNSFVFNVDTPHELVRTYAGYYLRNEPLNTLDRIQDIYLSITSEQLLIMARKYLVPKRLQIFVVGDGNIRFKRRDMSLSLKKELQILSDELGIPFKDIPLR
jgi:zinc protease